MKTMCVFVCSILFIPFLFGQIPRTISYQGILTDNAGNPKPDGSYTIAFSFYESSAGGDAIWNEIKTLNISKGLFSTSLGDQVIFGSNVKFDKPYWLGIKVGDEAELSPRIVLTSAGYSFSAINSDTTKNIIDGKVVKSLNNLKDNVTFEGGGGTTINSNGNTITISSNGTGGTGIQGIQNTNNTIDIINPNGPSATTNLKIPLTLNGSTNGSNYLFTANNTGSGHGSLSQSVSGYGAVGIAYGTTGQTIGVVGNSFSPDGYAVFGLNLATTGNSIGLLGRTNSSTGVGVWGDAPSGGIGLKGTSTSGSGVQGISNSWAGVYGESSTWFGVWGKATGPNGKGVFGESAESFGVWGKSPNSSGVVGESDNWVGVYGESEAGNGVLGKSVSAMGVYGESTIATGVYGTTKGYRQYSVLGKSTYSSANTDATFGALGYYGDISLGYDRSIGVVGITDDAANAGIAIYGYSLNAEAGYFNGLVDIDGPLLIFGNLQVSGQKLFKIDHPLEPENKYLIHSCVESSERMDIYNGNIITDGSGSATVELPGYFEALNVEYRYQLTTIGQPAQVWIEKKIQNNRFEIRSDKPNVEISWQVTGIRNDEYAKQHPFVVEQDKEQKDKGKYLMPELFGQPKEMGIHYVKVEKPKFNQQQLKENRKANKNEVK